MSVTNAEALVTNAEASVTNAEASVTNAEAFGGRSLGVRLDAGGEKVWHDDKNASKFSSSGP